MLITQISLANTFSDWLYSTQKLITNSNDLEIGNYFKTANTLYITSDGSDINGKLTALYVNNHAYFGSISIGNDAGGNGDLTANNIFANNIIVYETVTSDDIFANNIYITYTTRTEDLYANNIYANNIYAKRGIFDYLEANTANIKDLFVSNSFNFSPNLVFDPLFVGNTITMCTRTPQTNGQIVVARGENNNPANANATLRWSESNKKWVIRDVDSPASYYSILLDDNSYIRLTKLGSGVPSISTYLCGDGTWRTISIPEGGGGGSGNVGDVGVANTYIPFRETFTASANQTEFTVTQGYIPNQIDVFYNGSKLVNAEDVLVSNGSVITLTTGAATGSYIDVVGYRRSTINIGQIIVNETESASNLNVMLTSANSGSVVDTYVGGSKPLKYNASSGTLYAYQTSYPSDITLKDNITDINNPINVIKLLNPVEFTWKDTGAKSYGVIAQELEQILPELVSNCDNVKSVNYIPLIAFLLGAVKDLDARLQLLENK